MKESAERRCRRQILRAPKPAHTIRTDTDDPRLPRVPLGVQDSQTVLDLMTLEYLEGYDERVGEQIRVHGCMEDVDRPVVRSGEEKGENGREGHLTECARVVAESFVGSGREVEVVPDETAIVGSDDEIVCRDERSAARSKRTTTKAP